MEAETALVGAECGVELNAVAPVDLDLLLVIFPGDTELDDSLGDGGNLQGFPVLGLLLKEGGVLEGRGQFCASCQWLARWGNSRDFKVAALVLQLPL